jgi:hypothetical protein
MEDTSLEFCYYYYRVFCINLFICPPNAQYILTICVFSSTPTCFDFYKSSSGNVLLCKLKFQINNTKSCIQFFAIKNQLIIIIKTNNCDRLFTILDIFFLFTVHRSLLCGWWLYIQLREIQLFVLLVQSLLVERLV